MQTSVNSNSNMTFIALNLHQKTDSKAHLPRNQKFNVNEMP